MTAPRPRTPSTHPDRAMTLVELAAVLLVVLVVAAISYAGLSAVLTRSEGDLSRLTLERVVLAQTSHAVSTGGWAISPTGDDQVLDDALQGLRADLDVTHGRSTGPDQVSVAVSRSGLLTLAVEQSDGSCLTALVTSPTTPDIVEYSTLAASRLCDAVSLLPLGDPPVSTR